QLEATLVDGRSPSLEHAARLREVSALFARELLRAGSAELALARAALELEHQDATATSLLTVGDLFRRARSWEQLERTAARLVAAFPARPEGFIMAADALSARWRFAEALPHLERARAADRYHGFEWVTAAMLGRAQLMTGDLENGRNNLRRSLALRPNQPQLEALLAASPDELRQIAGRYPTPADARHSRRS